MLQVIEGTNSPFKIKSFRKVDKAECTPAVAVCSVDADDGTGKPPC